MEEFNIIILRSFRNWSKLCVAIKRGNLLLCEFRCHWFWCSSYQNSLHISMKCCCFSEAFSKGKQWKSFSARADTRHRAPWAACLASLPPGQQLPMNAQPLTPHNYHHTFNPLTPLYESLYGTASGPNSFFNLYCFYYGFVMQAYGHPQTVMRYG